MKDIYWLPATPDSNGWKARHTAALRGIPDSRGIVGALEMSIVMMLRGWLAYADAHLLAYGSALGADYVLGEAWFATGVAMLTLLNGDLGRLDAGTLDTIIRDNLEEQGWDCDGGERRKS